MIPLRDVIPSRTTPYITVTIIALNAVAWLYEVALPHEALNQFLTIYGVVPAYFAWPTLVTSMFLHGSWSHVIGNMWYLWIFGDNVEDRVGHGRFIVFYLLCGIAAALGQVAMDPNSMLPTSDFKAGISPFEGLQLQASYAYLNTKLQDVLDVTSFVLSKNSTLAGLGLVTSE